VQQQPWQRVTCADVVLLLLLPLRLLQFSTASLYPAR
jgi:hypothetical protein